MKKLFLTTFIMLCSLQPLISNAQTSHNKSHKKPVFNTVQQMEEQCMGFYMGSLGQIKNPPKLTLIGSSSKKVRDEVEILLELTKSDVKGTIKYNCSFKNGSLTTHGPA